MGGITLAALHYDSLRNIFHPPPEPDYGVELDLVDDDEVDKDTVIGRQSSSRPHGEQDST
jgi:hypothetical protein